MECKRSAEQRAYTTKKKRSAVPGTAHTHTQKAKTPAVIAYYILTGDGDAEALSRTGSSVTVGDDGVIVGGGGGGGGDKPQLVDHALASQHNLSESIHDALCFGRQSVRGVFRAGRGGVEVWCGVMCVGRVDIDKNNKGGGEGREGGGSGGERRKGGRHE